MHNSSLTYAQRLICLTCNVLTSATWTNNAQGLSLHPKCYLGGCRDAVPLQHLTPVSYPVQLQVPVQSFNGIWIPLTGYHPCCTCTISTHTHQASEDRGSAELATMLRHYLEISMPYVLWRMVERLVFHAELTACCCDADSAFA